MSIIGVSVPGFFADQSPEILDFSVKGVYYTALWTAHVCHPMSGSHL